MQSAHKRLIPLLTVATCVQNHSHHLNYHLNTVIFYIVTETFTEMTEITSKNVH